MLQIFLAFQMSTFGILYPNGCATTNFGNWLLTKGHTVLLYTPVDPYTPLTRSIVLDLEIQARLQGSTELKFQVLREPNLEDCDYFVVPNLDVLPNTSDKDYAHMCMTTFR